MDHPAPEVLTPRTVRPATVPERSHLAVLEEGWWCGPMMARARRERAIERRVPGGLAVLCDRLVRVEPVVCGA